MECIETRALKSSFLSQMAIKTNSQAFCNDDVWCFAGVNTVSSDEFPVEDLLNLDFSEMEFHGSQLEDDAEAKVGLEEINSSHSPSAFSGADEFPSLSAAELAVPVDDLENLEWLSQFVDDSTSGLSLLCPAGSFTGNRVEKVTKPPVQKIRLPFLPFPVQRKQRSKRSRTTGRRPWYLSSPPLSAGVDSSPTSSSHGSSVVPVPTFFFTAPVQKKKPEADGGSGSGRRCTHCQVQKTPQWRTGPLGPKTLCNACGVRFKSGRLFPEYRPACSPTFSQEVHSNSHRKVVEMRLKKEVARGG
ncbi:hypothetical protein ABFS82_14G117000 [Erythranthe guttata]|uniref:GATA transcription factor n=1 Tax=Erythranthe guttata TaxID=4155 RepID=A0A022RR85_ERYGU|nr:PREDICTED: GATA transcription factor 5-like [Erythranthe guttata]EYU42584.1 hypothetical protein MIMGU_mgv1a010838mg [Erythranthe guttata]|eukprot:XP_012830959.1 PREDICTED: GATA transcription factor 5-like [Erythranthe guttata]